MGTTEFDPGADPVCSVHCRVSTYCPSVRDTESWSNMTCLVAYADDTQITICVSSA